MWCNTTLSGSDAATPFIVMGVSQQGNSVLIMPQYVYEAHHMEPQNVVDTYNNSDMDTYLTSTDATGYRMKYLPEAFRNILVSTTIEAYVISSDTTITMSRDIFIASETEVVASGAAHAEGISFLSALKTATSETKDNNARKAYNTAGNVQDWWLRTPFSTSQFQVVFNNGDVIERGAIRENYVRPLYSVAPATLVSDAGAETIYLFPDEATPYRELDVEIGMGESAKRPKKARVVTTITKATESSIKATNNFGDANPTWETVAADGTVTFANTTKTTDNWELGVKIYARSQDKAEATEPAMIVEVDE